MLANVIQSSRYFLEKLSNVYRAAIRLYDSEKCVGCIEQWEILFDVSTDIDYCEDITNDGDLKVCFQHLLNIIGEALQQSHGVWARTNRPRLHDHDFEEQSEDEDDEEEEDRRSSKPWSPLVATSFAEEEGRNHGVHRCEDGRIHGCLPSSLGVLIPERP